MSEPGEFRLECVTVIVARLISQNSVLTQACVWNFGKRKNERGKEKQRGVKKRVDKRQKFPPSPFTHEPRAFPLG